MIESDVVVSGYRLLLDREVESASVVAEKREKTATLEELVINLVCSNEFLSRNRDLLLAHF